MKAAAFAMSGPHVSAIISSVRARVPISIPLLTKIKSGILLGLSKGRRIAKIFLMSGQIESNSAEKRLSYLRNCVGIAKRRTSISSKTSFVGISGPMAVIF